MGTFSSSGKDMKIDSLPMDSFINLDQGDPGMFGPYWERQGDKGKAVIAASDSMSYFSEPSNLCWFMDPKLTDEIKRLHGLVGNAVTEDRHIIVGTGSTQLCLALLYALSCDEEQQPVAVVCATPYYSSFKDLVELLQSQLYKWEGDARTFDKEGPYIEMVISPNNPDGELSQPVVKSTSKGKQINDFAYYWPQYTPITHAADHDHMLFTLSKCTGHAGSRIGWAIIKDDEVARKMVKFITISSIGVSKESQLRAAKILEVINKDCEKSIAHSLFEEGRLIMRERWRKLQSVLKNSDVFSIPDFPPSYCNFFGKVLEPNPAYVWLKSKEEIDTESLFRDAKMQVRGGVRFGHDKKYARVSMLCKDDILELFLERISAMSNKAI
ncbi:hypothetical protein ACFE04_025121 [Oxalis oulophora]